MQKSQQNVSFYVKCIAYSSICIALAFVLHMLKLHDLPYGGSITLFSMFFVAYIGFLAGPLFGLAGGAAFGLLLLLISPTIVHPLQLLLDYPLAFMFLGVTGLFPKTQLGLTLGFTIGCFLRYIAHVISGCIFFYMYAEGTPVLIYSLQYNLTYILPEAVLTLVILSIPIVGYNLQKVRRQLYNR